MEPAADGLIVDATRWFTLEGYSPMIKLVALLLLCIGPWEVGAARAEPLTIETINQATAPARGQKPSRAALIKAQVLLDRAGFSPGVIDGRAGDNFERALMAFQESAGLTASGKLDADVWAKLTEATAPVAIEYAIAAADLKGPFVESIPRDYERMAELDHLGYHGPRELLAEKFHMDEELLRALNPDARFDREGEKITVANPQRRSERTRAAKLIIDKRERTLRAYDRDGALIAHYPATVGSEEKPAPSGVFEVRAVAENPTYRYDPAFGFKGQKATEPVEVAPGPNNPVGAVWIALSAESYGIHGTPEPDKIGKTASHGCVRLTNWDALALAKMVKKGTPVELVD